MNIKSIAKWLFSKLGYRVTRIYGESAEIKGYAGEEFIAKANAAGLSLWDYYDTIWQPACSFERLVSEYIAPRMGGNLTVVEIGAGAGRLAARLISKLDIKRFYSFEPSKVLCKYLSDRFPGRVTNMPVSGSALTGVPDASADLVAAVGVFTYLQTSTIFKYLNECERVLKPGGILFFDILDTDGCSRDLFDFVRLYARGDHERQFMSARFFSAYLADMKFTLLDPLPPAGTSEGGYGSQFLIFEKAG